jgi:hypothetical protein
MPHWNAAKRVLKYLAGSQDVTIRYSRSPGSPNTLVGYCDSDYAGCTDSRRSHTGFVFLLNGGPIAWQSKRQDLVTRSSTEAEYVALSTAGSTAIHLRRLLEDLGYPQKEATVIHEDNYGCICLTRTRAINQRTKHIDVRFHWIREAVERGDLYIQQCGTNDQAADILTKPLSAPVFKAARELMLRKQ